MSTKILINNAGFIIILFLIMNYFEHNKHLEPIKVLIQYIFLISLCLYIIKSND